VSGFDPHGSGDDGAFDPGGPGGGYQDGDGDGADEGAPGDGSSRVSEFPSFAIDLPTPKAAARSFVRLLFAASLLLGGIALFAVDRGARGIAELTGLFGLALLALTFPALALARQLEQYPRKGRVRLDRRGFKLPWLGREVPGPEGPWEALRGFRVLHAKNAGGRTLVIEMPAGGFSLKDRWIGVEAFDAALNVLERALGPQGVLLGTVVRLPIHPTDTRRLRDRLFPTLIALGAMAAFLALATLAVGITVKIAAFLCAVVAVIAGWGVQAWDRAPGAELVLTLDGLVVPLPEDLRRSIKLPFAALLRGAVDDAGTSSRTGARPGPQRAIVIEHARGRLLYPLDWADPREAREFVRQLSKRTT
jgi:hypothetical protein